jgi:hypothetical protein
MHFKSMPLLADIRVGETTGAYERRKGIREVPFLVPQKIHGMKTGFTAHITEFTLTRVVGDLMFRDWKGKVISRTFNVKHDLTKFSVGSGSGKSTFYFKNSESK